MNYSWLHVHMIPCENSLLLFHSPPLPRNRDWPCGSSLLTRGKYLGILQDSEGCGRTELAAEAAAEAAVHPQNKCQISNQWVKIGSDDVKQMR